MNESGLVGLPVGSAVDAIVDRGDGDRDPDTVREALDPVTEDGVVTREAVDDTVSDTSKLVATAETRVELAGIAHEDATAAADPVADIDVVAARLGTYDDRLAAVEARAADLSDGLRTPVEQLGDPGAVYELAVELREVAATAQNVAREADELSFDLEAFESWLASPDRRYDELAEDIDLVSGSLEELSAAADALSASETPAADWADATMRAHVMALLATDLCAEAADLRTWADREGDPFRAELADRVAATEREARALVETLSEHGEPAWHDRFGSDLAAFERALSAFAPPVDWDRVRETLEERRAAAFD